MLTGPHQVWKFYALKWSKTANFFNKKLCIVKTTKPSRISLFFNLEILERSNRIFLISNSMCSNVTQFKYIILTVRIALNIQ